MTTKYQTFESAQQAGKEYIIAQPKRQRDDPVRLPADIKVPEDPGVDAPYRDVIKGLIKQDLSKSMNLGDGEGGTLDRNDAIESLTNAEDAPIDIDSEQAAEAIIDYFVSKGVLETESGTEVAVLSAPDDLVDFADQDADTDVSEKMLLNWMSAIESSTTKIEETIQKVEEVEEKLREQVGGLDASDKIEKYEKKQEEVAQRLMNLTNGGALEREDLSEREQAEYDRLEERLFHLDAMKDSIGEETSDLDQKVRKMAEECNHRVELLKDTKESLQTQKESLHDMHAVSQIDYEQAQQLADSLSDVASAVAGVASTEERVEEGDTMGRAQAILSDTEQFQQMSQDQESTEASGANIEQDV